MDTATQGKWDRTARIFDFMTGRGPERRWGPAKRRLFAHMQGRILFLALGTGLDIESFPPGQAITAIDISPEMLAKAAPRVAAYDGDIEARVMDVHELDMDDATQEAKAQRPLREARIDVIDDKARPGCYQAIAYLKPHFQLDELGVSLRLVADLPEPAQK